MAFKFPSENWQVLLNPDREEWQSVENFLEVIKPKSSEIWIDLGCGPGYFTLPLAKKIKKIYAVDLEEKMLEVCKIRSEKEGIKNIEFIKCSEDKIPIPEDEVDRILMANLFHELLKPEEFLEEVKRILKPSGKLILIDWHPIPSPAGPPLEERIPKDEVIDFLTKIKFKFLTDFDIYPYHYFLEFEPWT